MPAGYSARDAATMLGVPLTRVSAWAEWLGLAGGPRELRVSFQDLVLLRTAKGLADAKVPAATIRRSLKRLRAQLPEGRAITGVRIAADGRRVVARDGASVWNPESGQSLFDFAVAEVATAAAPHARRAAEEARREGAKLDASDWYRLGCDIEASSPADARDAYRRAVELEPHHADAHVNLGRLLHEDGKTGAAEVHYRIALTANPKHAAAAFNLGVALEDRGKLHEAAQAYERALVSDPDFLDAHYNLGLLYEKLGKPSAAIRHLSAYKKALDGVWESRRRRASERSDAPRTASAFGGPAGGTGCRRLLDEPHERRQGAVDGRRNAERLAPPRDEPVHRVDLCPPAARDVLLHRRRRPRHRLGELQGRAEGVALPHRDAGRRRDREDFRDGLREEPPVPRARNRSGRTGREREPRRD